MIENIYRSVGYHFATSLPLILLRGIGLQVYTKDYYWNNRKRLEQHCVFQYTLEGNGELEINHTLYPLKEGDGFFINLPGPHSYGISSSSTSWKVLYLEFTKEVLPILHQVHSQHGIVFHIPKTNAIIQQALTIYEDALQESNYDIYHNSKVAYGFIMDFSQYIMNGKQHSANSSIEECKIYIENHYANAFLSLDDLSTHCNLSKFHMTRLFEQSYGITPGRYIIECRLRNCARMLIETKMTVHEIALLSGYENGNYLSKSFKKHYKTTPSTFRKGKENHDISKILFEK